MLQITAQLNVLLSENEIMEDLRIINKLGGKPLGKKPQQSSISSSIFPDSSNDAGSSADHVCDARIEDGRLYYEKKWWVLQSGPFLVYRIVEPYPWN